MAKTIKIVEETPVVVDGRDRILRTETIIDADKLKSVFEVLRLLIDPDPCSYDHHGYCQAHSLHPKPCPHELAKEILKGTPK